MQVDGGGPPVLAKYDDKTCSWTLHEVNGDGSTGPPLSYSNQRMLLLASNAEFVLRMTSDQDGETEVGRAMIAVREALLRGIE